MTRTASQNARRSRSKGAAWERDLSAVLRAVYPEAARCIAQSRTAKREGCDVEGTPWWVESKVGARPDILGAIRQALADTDGRPVLVVTKQDRGVPLATLPLAELLRLLIERDNQPMRERLEQAYGALADAPFGPAEGA